MPPHWPYWVWVAPAADDVELAGAVDADDADEAGADVTELDADEALLELGPVLPELPLPIAVVMGPLSMYTPEM